MSRLVVIGGGIVGAATAYHAARGGIDVLLLEERPALCTLTTPVSTGAFRLQFATREETDLVRESIAIFERLGVGRAAGYLWLTTSPERARDQRALVERQHGWGLHDIELLDGDEVRHRFPYVSADVVQARYRAADG